MKKILSMLMIAAFLSLNIPVSYADIANPTPTGTVDVKVTIEKTVSIAVEGGPIDLQKIKVGETAVSSSPITIKNDGSGADETITIAVANPAGWTSGTPGDEAYRVSFKLSDTQPAAADSDWKTPDVFLGTAAYGDANKQKLWVKFEAPTSTKVATEQTIGITITAQ